MYGCICHLSSKESSSHRWNLNQITRLILNFILFHTLIDMCTLNLVCIYLCFKEKIAWAIAAYRLQRGIFICIKTFLWMLVQASFDQNPPVLFTKRSTLLENQEVGKRISNEEQLSCFLASLLTTSKTNALSGSYLQCTTMGPASGGLQVLTLRKKARKGVGCSGTPWSGQAVNWNCLTSLFSLDPFCEVGRLGKILRS